MTNTNKTTLEELTREWANIGGSGELPRLEVKDYKNRVENLLDSYCKKNKICSSNSPFIKSLVNYELPRMLKERGIDYKGIETQDLDLIKAYGLVAELELELFPISTGFNGGLTKKGYDPIWGDSKRGTIEEDILENVLKRTGYFQKPGKLDSIFRTFIPKSLKDFGNEYDLVQLYLDWEGNKGKDVDRFVNEVYPNKKQFFDYLADKQEEVYKKAVEKIPDVKKMGYSGWDEHSISNRIHLGWFRPAVVYAKQHKIDPLRSGMGIKGWNYEEIFKIKN
ncbi:MAG: hypothetical protein ACP5OG_00045 [Candidatus Nanoarchaeia archaeon]